MVECGWIPFTDEDTWLADRRRFITATDAAKLISSAGSWKTIRADKEGRGRRIPQTAAMAWGHEREPALIAAASDHLGVPVAPNSALAFRGNYSATPDGVALDMLVECKTGSASTLKRNLRSFTDQCQWQMLVCDFPSVLLVREVREDDPEGGFVPGEITFDVIERDEKRISELVEVVERFRSEGEGSTDWELDMLIADVVAIDAELEKVKSRREDAAKALREYIGDRDFRHAGSCGSVSLTAPKSKVVDVDALTAAHPDVVKKFSKSVVDLKALTAARPDVVAEFESEKLGTRRLVVRETAPEVKA